MFGVDDVHDDAAFEHLSETGFDEERVLGGAIGGGLCAGRGVADGNGGGGGAVGGVVVDSHLERGVEAKVVLTRR